MEKLHEDDRMAVKTPFVLYNTMYNGSKLQVHLWQDVHQWCVKEASMISLLVSKIIKQWFGHCYT